MRWAAVTKDSQRFPHTSRADLARIAPITERHFRQHGRVVESSEPPQSRPLRLDSSSESVDPALPAFLSRPADAPAYHGFPILDDVAIEGFRLGMITDFLAQPGAEGDAFVIAPDGSRAGLVWEAEAEAAYISEVMAPDDRRWGVWAVGLSLPLRSLDDARAYLAALLPELKPRWERWAQASTNPPS